MTEKTLIIAEKPSVAQDIVRALTPTAGKFDKHADHFENERYVVTSAVGHLVEIQAPEEYDVKRGKWSFAHLPVVPPRFDLAPIERGKTRLNAVVKLVKRKDVSHLINACDAGREGELIFRLIVQYADTAKAKLNKPIQRLWLQSMTPQAIRDGFDHLRADKQMLGLADAARSRSEADWLVGINGTRAMTAFNSRDGGFFLTTVGRVQTPTLSIVVEREEKIRKHISRPYWEVKGTFLAAAGSYEGKWFDSKYKKGDDADTRADRLWDAKTAEAIKAACLGQPASVVDEAKPSTQASGLLYDLTTLQREANGRFGFSAKTTLQLAQALYEKHKVLTYPRTDSRALPEDYLQVAKDTMKMLATEDLPGPLRALSAHAKKAVKEGYVKPAKRVFDNAKVSDHFAIIPTLQAPKALTEIEAKLYDMVVKRFVAVFYPSAEFMVTTRVSTVKVADKDYPFQTNGKVLVNPGWLAVYGKEAQEDDANLVAVAPGEKVKAADVDVLALKTKPPARYSEATLLSAMEGAGKLIDDDELREAMQEKGLGTPATRAAIIEGLLNEKYMLREGRELIPTAKAFQLMTLLRGLDIEDLTKPELTGNWEYQLAEMEHGRLKRDTFMAEIAKMAERIVKKAKEYDRDTIPGDYATLSVPCPNCGGTVKENYRRYACDGRGSAPGGASCEFSITKIPAGRAFEIAEVEAFLRDKKVGPLEGFRSKAGWPFTAELKLAYDDEIKNWKLEFDFGESDKDKADGTPVDFSEQESLGACPKCKGRVFEHGTSYVCEHAVGATITCDFKTGKIILQQPVAREEVTKLLATGKTSLLENFVSNKTRRKFKAYLAYDKKEGKVSFEFEPRASKFPPKAGAKAADKAADKAVGAAADEAAPPPAKKVVAKKAAKENAVTAAIAIKLLAVLVTAAIGYLAGRMRWLVIGAPGSDAARVLSNVAFYVFIPALLFRTTARVDFETMPWRTIAAFFVPVVVVMLGVYAWQRLRGPASPAVPTVRAIAVAFGNTVQLGIPFSAALYGEAGLAIHIPLISLHALIILTTLTVLVELDLARHAGRDGGARPSLARTLATTARNTLIHPVVLPVLAGLVWNLAGLPLPALADELLATLGSAVVPLCLVLIGVSLSQYGVKGHLRGALAATVGKLFVLPATVLVVAHWGFGLSGVPLAVLVMAAALPVGSNALLFAQRYATLEAEATAAIVASTVAFVATAALWLGVLGLMG